MKRLAEIGTLDADLASAFEASSNPYVLMTPDLRFAGMNGAYLAAVGQTRDALIGRNMFEVFDAGPTEQGARNQRQLRDSFQRVLDTGERDHLALIAYDIPVRGENGEERLEERFWSATHTPLRDASGQIAYILQHTTDITELEHLRRRFSARGPAGPSDIDAVVGGEVLARAESVQADNARLQSERDRLRDLFMQAPGFMALLSGPEHRFELHNAAYSALVGRGDLIGKPIRDALPEIEGQGYRELLDHVFATGEPHAGRRSRVELQRALGRPMDELYLDFIYQPIRDVRGVVIGVLVHGYEVTDSVLADQRQKLMIDELNHRVKNTLSTVQSIAMQTARTHADPQSFAQSFQSRLLALSHTHDLLTRQHWEGADLRAILEHETEAHGETRIVLNGPAVALPPAAALSLGMVFHELATNAAKYGALSVGEGRVFVDWSVAPTDDRRLRLVWRETGGPATSAPERKGFGTRLVERNVRHDLGGEATADWTTEGLSVELSIPLNRNPSA